MPFRMLQVVMFLMIWRRGVCARHSCFEINSPVFFVTSFNNFWLLRMKEINPNFKSTVYAAPPSFPFVVYHEDQLIEHNSSACFVNMRSEMPWLDFELKNSTSGLNRYFAIAGVSEPNNPNPRPEAINDQAVLLLKVASVEHAVRHARPGTLVFWVDTDVTFRKPLPPHVISWLTSRDITYIPFFLDRGDWSKFDPNSSTSADKTLLGDLWKVESGLVAITVNIKTQRLMHRAVRLYCGDMYFLAQACFQNLELCKPWRIRSNVWLNDIYVFAILLQADAHQDAFFWVGLKQGWFAMAGLEPWGDQHATWGAGTWKHFAPSTANDTLAANFNIGEFIFHHFGSFAYGVYSAQAHTQHTKTANDTWRLVGQHGDPSKTLLAHIYG